MIYIYPNTTSTFKGDREIALASGYVEVTEQDYADLIATKKKWENGYIVDDTTYDERQRAKEEDERKRQEREEIQNQINALKNWFDIYYRKYNEKLTRFAALEIEETIEDTVRGKTYNTLRDLYVEAEVVKSEINMLENRLHG